MEREKAPIVNATDFSEMASLPLGSLQSRAAARLLLERRREGERRADLIVVFEGIPPERIGAEGETRDADGVLRRSIALAPGTLLADGLRRVGGFSEADLEQASREYPEPLQGHEMIYVEH